VDHQPLVSQFFERIGETEQFTGLLLLTPSMSLIPSAFTAPEPSTLTRKAIRAPQADLLGRQTAASSQTRDALYSACPEHQILPSALHLASISTTSRICDRRYAANGDSPDTGVSAFFRFWSVTPATFMRTKVVVVEKQSDFQRQSAVRPSRSRLKRRMASAHLTASFYNPLPHTASLSYSEKIWTG